MTIPSKNMKKKNKSKDEKVLIKRNKEKIREKAYRLNLYDKYQKIKKHNKIKKDEIMIKNNEILSIPMI
jgi:hypothetical protein